MSGPSLSKAEIELEEALHHIDELEAEVERLKGALKSWQEELEIYKTTESDENTQLRAALEQVEWVEVRGVWHCPWCQRFGESTIPGHAPDCPRQKVLKEGACDD